MYLHLMSLHLMRTMSKGAKPMRTTLEIDDDVLEAAKSLARQSDKTAGAVLSDLARRALTNVPAKPTRSAGVGGFVPFESRGGLVTNEQIDRLREQDAY
jgi:predicted transcriptional regulator